MDSRFCEVESRIQNRRISHAKCKITESRIPNHRIHLVDSTIPPRFCNAKLKKLLLLLAFAKSRIPLTLPTPINQETQFCRIHLIDSANRRISHEVRNLAPLVILRRQSRRSIQKKLLLLLAFAKSRILSLMPTLIHQRFHNPAESRVDSTKL